MFIQKLQSPCSCGPVFSGFKTIRRGISMWLHLHTVTRFNSCHRFFMHLVIAQTSEKCWFLATRVCHFPNQIQNSGFSVLFISHMYGTLLPVAINIIIIPNQKKVTLSFHKPQLQFGSLSGPGNSFYHSPRTPPLPQPNHCWDIAALKTIWMSFGCENQCTWNQCGLVCSIAVVAAIGLYGEKWDPNWILFSRFSLSVPGLKLTQSCSCFE